ncbi:MAG: flagellar filament capping protein FliD [Lachnospiraceae bacterium]|jgi:flagellar hook-associated protein 2|nr:flagellar filament capping protein FliD [Lachnospiraceae bacterium]MEE3460584.1 flagellar filament capping protein FliD [Lachnospiraceae bacterium]
MGIRMSGLTSGMDTESVVSALMATQKQKQTKIKGNKQKLEWKQEAWKSLNTDLYGFYTGALSKAKMHGSYNTKKASVSDQSLLKVTAGNDAVKGATAIEIKQIAKAQTVTSGKVRGADGSRHYVSSSDKLTDLGIDEGTVLKIETSDDGKTTSGELTVTADTTINDYVNALKKNGLNASYDSDQGRFFISSKESGADHTFKLSASKDGNASDALTYLGLDSTVDNIAKAEGSDKNGMVVVASQDSEVVMNGATLTSSSSTLKANGLTLDLLGTTAAGKTVNINVSDDPDSAYDTIKDFVDNFNSLLTTMSEKYNASSANDYDVLTDDQKKDMSDEDIKNWNDKIKGSLLRRDDTLEGLISTFRDITSESVKVNGKSYSLSSLGITTSKDWKEGGLLHIHGDEDDDEYSDDKNTLKTMLSNDPDTAVEIITQLTGKLYDKMQEKMGKTKLSSAMTFYNDIEMRDQINDYKKEISDWDDKLADMEERYYSQFTNMEKMLSEINAKQSQLSGLLG